MTDIVNPLTRSRMMSCVRSKDTGPELALRRRLFARGYRFRVHRADLPGRPDITFPKYSAVILVHGCFWHLHGCSRSTIPKAHRAWWAAKLRATAARDKAIEAELRERGWRVLTIWECSFRGRRGYGGALLDDIAILADGFLRSDAPQMTIPAKLQRPPTEGLPDNAEETA